MKQQQKLLPVDYYMITFPPLPHELNPWVWHHQKWAYSFLFKTAKDNTRLLFKKI